MPRSIAGERIACCRRTSGAVCLSLDEFDSPGWAALEWIVYQHSGFTPVWSVSQWWLAGGWVTRQAVCVGGVNVIDRRSVDVLTAHWSVFYRFLLKVVD